MSDATKLAAAQKRIDELLAFIQRLSQTVPYEEERGNVATLIAEVGTLRSRVRSLETALAEHLGPRWAPKPAIVLDEVYNEAAPRTVMCQLCGAEAHALCTLVGGPDAGKPMHGTVHLQRAFPGGDRPFRR